jgi:hypothetical protein
VRSGTSVMYQTFLAASHRAPRALTASFSAKGVTRLMRMAGIMNVSNFRRRPQTRCGDPHRIDAKIKAGGKVVKQLSQPMRQQSSQTSTKRFLGSYTFGLLGATCIALFAASVFKAIPMHPVPPALKAGIGFFFCLGASCCYAFWWIRQPHPDSAGGLVVHDRIVKVRIHRDSPVFMAQQCLYFEGIEDNAAYRKAITGLQTGVHIFYLDDGEYLTAEGIEATLAKSDSRQALKFMRCFKNYQKVQSDVKDAHVWE